MSSRPPASGGVRSREAIGVDQFSQRREVFDQHATVFLPPPQSPPPAARAAAAPPILTSNHAKTTANFRRNAPTYSSMREPRDERNIEFRARKYSDNFTSEHGSGDELDYRRSMTERTRRLSKLRRDFLNSNLHEAGTDGAFNRAGTRATLPAHSASTLKYKIESPNLYKFPFAEPYATPPPARRVVVDLGPAVVNGEKENLDPAQKARHQSLPGPNAIAPKKIDHQRLFEELVKRYSPERKPVDWKLPPTRPRVVGSVPKSTSSTADSLDGHDKKKLEEAFNKAEDDDVFVQKDVIKRETAKVEIVKDESDEDDGKATAENAKKKNNFEASQNGPAKLRDEKADNAARDSKLSLSELDEKNDEVPEMSMIAKQNREIPKRPSLDKYTDLTIPALIDKITEEGEGLENHQKEKKVKRKRSFLDKLLGRKKEVK